MVGAPMMGVGGKTGEALENLYFESIAVHPRFNSAELRARLAVLVGDGALCSGGPSARHNSTKALERIWTQLHPQMRFTCTRWDDFHKRDLASWRAVTAVPLAAEVYEVVHELDQTFGINEGRLVFQGAVEFAQNHVPWAEAAPASTRGAGGTRKMGHLSNVVVNLHKNFQFYILGLSGRIAWKKAGHGKKTVQKILELSRRLDNVRFVAFTCFFADCLSQISITMRDAQCTRDPCRLLENQERFLRELSTSAADLEWMRVCLAVGTLCAQHLAPSEFALFLTCIASAARMRHRCPTFCKHMVGVLFALLHAQGPAL